MAKLNSLVDLLKINLYFTEGLTISELTRSIQNKMLQDYTFLQAQKSVVSCLHQCGCFYSPQGYIWFMDKQGMRENDQFFNMLFKHQRALKFTTTAKIKHSQKNNKIIPLPTNLVSDGRFVQLEGGHWGLTEWEIEINEYRLRHIVIKVLANNPKGLNYSEVDNKVEIWKQALPNAVRDILHKYPYFIKIDEKWIYHLQIRTVYDLLIERYVRALNKKQLMHLKKINKVNSKILSKNIQLEEISSAQKQIAAALAEKKQTLLDYDQLVQRFAEKDLLLSLRKRELLRCKQEKTRAEKKANSILYQCRLWVDKAKLKSQENKLISEEIKQTKTQIINLREKDRQQKYKQTQIKDEYATDKAKLIRENVNIKHQMEKLVGSSQAEIKELRNDMMRLTADLHRAIQENEERRYSCEVLEADYNNMKKENRLLKLKTRHPLVRFSMKLISLFEKSQN